MELSKISPTISTLKRIAQALEMPLGGFFNSPSGISKPTVPKPSLVVHRDQRKLLSPGKGITFQLLNPDMSGPIELIYNIYEPGTETDTEQYSHVGSECGLILEGKLLITIRDRNICLRKGTA